LFLRSGAVKSKREWILARVDGGEWSEGTRVFAIRGTDSFGRNSDIFMGQAGD
jgi:hypothetical protein